MIKPKITPMQLALKEAKLAAQKGEVPVGAVIVKNKRIIAKTHNKMIEHNDAMAHAEILAIKLAQKKLNNSRLSDCDLYVTLEPCTMCAGAISLARLRRLYYGAPDIKGGAIDNGVRFFNSLTCHHRPEIISGLNEEQAIKILKEFFASLR